MSYKQRLELDWVGKEQNFLLEPRILVRDDSLSINPSINGNLLIEGDNLLALKALETHYTNKIKCIYIDPPYNSGNAFDRYDDGIEHSQWLSLMKPRLEYLKKLLSPQGVIWISIDDKECHYLKVLCDEIYGRENFISCLPTIMNLKGNQDEFGFAGTHEYTLVYAKDKNLCKLYSFEIDEEEMESWSVDEVGYFKKGATMRATGEEQTREDRPFMFYPILVRGNHAFCIKPEEHAKLYNKDKKAFDDVFLNKIIKKYENEGYEVILPKVDASKFGRWRWGYSLENCKKIEDEVIVTRARGSVSLYKKQRPELGELPSKKPKSIFYKAEYSSGNGTNQIKKIFGFNAFPYPKPEELIRDIIQLSTKEGDFVLDSFLGSGTTAAVATKLNRRWIGVEMGSHCKELCYERVKKVINKEVVAGVAYSSNFDPEIGFTYLKLAPSLLLKDDRGNWIINDLYDALQLAEAVCKHERFNFFPSETTYWKQGYSTEKDFIFVTTQFLTAEHLDHIQSQMKRDETLLICAKAFRLNKEKHTNINLKKIPQMLLGRCEFGRDDYSLNVKKTDQEELDLN